MQGHQRRFRALALCTLFSLLVVGLAPASAGAEGWRREVRHGRGHHHELRRGDCGSRCGQARLRRPNARHHRGRHAHRAWSRGSRSHRGFHHYPHHLRHGHGVPDWKIPWLMIHGLSGLVVEHH